MMKDLKNMRSSKTEASIRFDEEVYPIVRRSGCLLWKGFTNRDRGVIREAKKSVERAKRWLKKVVRRKNQRVLSQNKGLKVKAMQQC